MNAKSKSIKSNLKKVDAHTIKPEEYDDLPELTDEMFERAVYKVGGIEKPAPRRRGPQKAATKTAVYLRLPPKVVDYFKSEGAGWQTKMGYALEDWMKKHPHHVGKSHA
jgi:uncharacterized protein (DUF4415 family)